MTKKAKSKTQLKPTNIILIIVIVCLFIASVAISGFTLYKVYNQKDEVHSTTANEEFKAHYVTSSEVIKSKTYYFAMHAYDYTATGGKLHACVYDAYDVENNTSSKIFTFKVIAQTETEKIQFDFSAYRGTTWRDWCNSNFNHFIFENETRHLSVADDGHIIFNQN